MKILKLIHFSLFYIWEIVKTNCIVAYEIVTPTHYMKPGFIKFDVSDLTDRQILIFCNLLTMTPGSLVVNLSDCHNYAYIHVLYLEDRDEIEKEIRESYLKRVKEVF